ncbi:MAG TPA: membrane protein insertase YidC [Planctomycetota bacterium]|nr:membrane protein insertase YidC [Planctomycetota bacterium]
MASEPKKFDFVTVVGIAFAAMLMFYGMTMRGKQQQAQQQQQQPGIPPAQAQAEKVVTPLEPAPASEPQAAPNVVVTGNYVEVSFDQTGAAIESARLPGVDQDAYKKDKKGLDLLAEIEAGKRTFGIPSFEIGPPNKHLIFDGAQRRSLDQRVWNKTDSGSFDANGIRTITYDLTITVPDTDPKKPPLENFTVTKTFTINNNPLGANLLGGNVKCDIKIVNKSGHDVECSYRIYGPQGILLDGPPDDPKNGGRAMVQAELAGHSGTDLELVQLYAAAAKAESEDGRKVSCTPDNLWGALKNRFFMTSLVSLDPKQLQKIVATHVQGPLQSLDKRFSEENIGIIGYRSVFTLGDGAVRNDPYALYLGPADDIHLDAAEVAMQTPEPYSMRSAIQFYDMGGWRWPRVDWLARQMMSLFRFLHKFFGSFGWAVVGMTIIIKMCLHPLQRKMMISMSKMQKLQPELNKIKEKYKNADDFETKRKMTLEQQDLMRKHGANPVAGCLPMFIQIPVFTALYGIFNRAFDMRGAAFLWIHDLSQSDRLSSLPFWPGQLNLLPVLYAILSFIQTRMTPQAKTDDPQQEMNRKMMAYMPVMFSLMFYSMPAGLVLYFAVSACWGMTESWYIKKFLIKDIGAPTAPVTGAGKGKPVAATAK